MSKSEKIKRILPDIWLVITMVGFCLVMIELIIKPTNPILKIVTDVVCYSIALVFVIKLGCLIGQSIKNIFNTLRNKKEE